MEKSELIKLLKQQIDILDYYKPFLHVIPGVQEPDCTKLFQAQIDLVIAIEDIEDN